MVLDYSKFNNIEDSDDGEDNVPVCKTVADKYADRTPAPTLTCSNCSKASTKHLVCGKCKNVAYCSSSCQKDDWQFHKRNCKEQLPMSQSLQQKFPGACVLGGSAQLPQQPIRTGLNIDETRVPDKPDKASLVDVKVEEPSFVDDKEKIPTNTMSPAFQLNRGFMDAARIESASVENTLLESAGSEKCNNCSQACSKPLKCGTCKAVIYCGTKCQREDWQFHRRHCKRPGAKVFCECGSMIKDGVMFCQTCGRRRPDERLDTNGPAPLRPQPSEDERVHEEEEVEDWYRHRDWHPEKKAEFHPNRIDSAEGISASDSEKQALDNVGAPDRKDMLLWWNEQLATLNLSCERSGLTLTVGQIKEVEGTAGIVSKHPSYSNEPSASFDGVLWQFDLRFEIEFDFCKSETTASGYPMQTSSSGRIFVTNFTNNTRSDFATRTDGPDVAIEVADAELIPSLRNALLKCISDYEALPQMCESNT